MSEDVINIRLGPYHLHVTRKCKISLTRNSFHVGYPEGRFAIYDLFGMRWTS